MTLWRVITSGKSCFVRSCSVLAAAASILSKITSFYVSMDVTMFLLMISSVAPTPTSSPEGDCTDVFSKESVQVNISWWGVCLWRSTSSSRPGPRDDDVMHRTMLGTVCSPWLQRWWSCFPILILNFSSLSINQCFHDNHHNHRNCILIIASLL